MIDIIYLEARLRSSHAMAEQAADFSARLIHQDMARSYARQLAAMRALDGHRASEMTVPFAPAVAPSIKTIARLARVTA